MFSDQEKLDISRQQYDELDVGREIRTKKSNTFIGYVSEVNHKAWGEDSYVITDEEIPENPTAEDYAKVKYVTILYQGSTAKLISHPIKTLTDWGPNNLLMGITILAPEALIPQRAPQMEEASETLQRALKTYPNAKIDIFAHSLGLMDGYGALADVKAEDAHRIRAAYLYNGPNPYKSFDSIQKENLRRLADKINVYIDTNDIVGFGYNTTNVIGNIYRIQTKGSNLIDQHMFGGYKFDAADNLVNVDGTLATEDIRLKHIDINNDGEIDFKIDSIDIRVRDLFTNGLFLATSSQKIQLNNSILEQLANNLEKTSSVELANIKRVTNLCSEKNNKINSSFNSRKTQVTEQVREVIKLSGMSYLIDSLYDSIGLIMKNKDILEEGASHSVLQMYRFNSSQTPIINGGILNHYIYNNQLAVLSYACESLLERLNKEQTGNELSIFSEGTPSTMKSWQVIEEASKDLLKKSDELFEGEGLREGKKDGISESLSIVLNVIAANTEEILASLNNVVSLVKGIAKNFDDADKWIGEKLEKGEFVPEFRYGAFPTNYSAYLERDEIFDDVKDVLQAFDRQVEKRSSEYAKKIAEVYQNVLGEFEEGLQDFLYFKDDLNQSLLQVTDNYGLNVYVKEEQITHELLNGKSVEKKTYPETYWGTLEQLYPYRTRENIARIRNVIIPALIQIQQAIWRSQNTRHMLGNLGTKLKPIVEDGVYHAFDLDEIVKGQKLVAAIANRLVQELNHVIQVMEAEGMQASAISTLKAKLSQTHQLIRYYVRFVNDCFGDNEFSDYVASSAGPNTEATFTLN
ncbi:SA1320 family protein [uncultured Granulicatella sp.]|uniref:SA1320 family protein n=1 Tax=uncultured Granulicatella sp. TaxID=316089 RepID=UPI002597A550|nr:hypothetical protein [uncultured Granulicatella sp.]